MPLSIVVLQALDSSSRADSILDRLQHQLAPAQRQTFNPHDVVRLPCKLLPDEALADVEHRLEALDAHWRDCIKIREPRQRRPARFTRSQPAAPRLADR